MDVRITNWEWDDGYPFGYPESYDADDWREPGWTCQVHRDPQQGLVEVEDVISWLNMSCTGFFDYTWRFNGGAPYLYVKIKDDADASAFLLRWKQ